MLIQPRDKEIKKRSEMVKLVKEHFTLLKMCTSKAEKLRCPDGQEGIYMKRVRGRGEEERERTVVGGK